LRCAPEIFATRSREVAAGAAHAQQGGAGGTGVVAGTGAVAGSGAAAEGGAAARTKDEMTEAEMTEAGIKETK
jgi:hypothetical protein